MPASSSATPTPPTNPKSNASTPPWPDWPKPSPSPSSALTVDLDVIAHADVWVPGLVLGVVLTVLIRPLAVGCCLVPVRLQPNERTFILVAGLKGAVPILLGEFLRAAHVPQADRLYGIVVVVVAFSLLVQGSSVPALGRRCIYRRAPPTPNLGDRRSATRGGLRGPLVHRRPGIQRDGTTVEELAHDAGDTWVSIVVRASAVLPVHPDTELSAGDDVVILAEPELADTLHDVFGRPTH